MSQAHQEPLSPGASNGAVPAAGQDGAKEPPPVWIDAEVLKEFQDAFQDASPASRDGKTAVEPVTLKVADNNSMQKLLETHEMTDALFKNATMSSVKNLGRQGNLAKVDHYPVTLEEMTDRLAKEKEICLKDQALKESWTGVNSVTRLVASKLPGGTPSDPLSLFHSMSKKDLEQWCQKEMLPVIVQTLLQNQSTTQPVEQKKKVQIANEKFSAPRTAVFGPIGDYFKGIVDRLGYPSTDLMKAVEDEHCHRDDSDDWFIPGNYQGFTTTPRTEFKSVTDSAEASRLTQEGKEGRKIIFWSTLKEHPAAKEAGLRQEEIIALQLYTGPMFMKYNTVLRDDPPELVKGLKDNKYVTTIFLIVSAIIKLSMQMELPKERCVWRGLKNLALHNQFMTKDKTGVRGGVERAMMSTSLDKSVAIDYAGTSEPMLFKIDIGAIDRGADVGFLSQYPREKEILFPPASFIEVVGEPFLDQLDGFPIRVVPLKINSNQVTKTIDDFLEHRKKLHVSMLTNFQAEIKHELNKRMESKEVSQRLEHDAFCAWNKHHVQLKESILSECKDIIQLYEEKTFDQYNDDNDYTKIMKQTLGMRTMATLKFDFWRDNASVQAFRLKDLPLKKVERSVMAQMRCKYFQALGDRGKDEEATKKAEELALEICKLRECCVTSVDEIVNEMGETPLMVASAEGLLVNLKYIINAGSTRINHRAKDGTSALMVAAAGGYEECCQYLIEQKASLDLKNNDEESCLYLACENGHLSVARFLVGQKKGLLYEARKDGVSCLWIASKNGHEHVVDYLVKEGGPELIKMKRKDQVTALNLACQNGHLGVVKILVSAGKESLKKDGESLALASDANNISALWIACSNGNTAVVRHLLEKGNIMEENGGSKSKREGLLKLKHKLTGQNCLHIAVKNGCLDTVKLLCQNIDNKEDFLFEVDSTGATSFMIACKNAHQHCAFYVLDEAGPRRDEMFEGKLKDGKNCLHLACESGNVKLFKSLLKKGTDELFLEQDSRGATCFSSACEFGKKDCVAHILERYGDDVLHRRLHDGTTVLHLVCKSGNAKLFDFLMEKQEEVVQAMLLEQDNLGITPLWLACSEGKDEIVERILKQGQKSTDKLELNSEIKKLLQIRDRQARSCIQIASEKGHVRVIRSLYAVQDASVLAEKDEEGATCFHIAVAKGFKASAEFLQSMDRKRQWTETLFDGKNALHLACQSKNLELVQFLMSKIDEQGSKKGNASTAKEGTSKTSSRRSSVSSRSSKATSGKSSLVSSPIKGKLQSTAANPDSKITTIEVAKPTEEDGQTGGGDKLETDDGPNSEGLLLQQDKDGATPLFFACSVGNKKMVLLLLDAAEKSRSLKKLLGLKSDDGRSCLHIASANGHVDIVAELIDHGCVKEIFESDESKATCLSYACEKGDAQCAKLLFDKAVQKRDGEAARRMLLGSRSDGQTVLHLICKSGSVELFNFLIEKAGEDLDFKKKDNDGQTCLFVACEHGKLELARFLVERKKELIMIRRTDGTSCLAIACAKGHVAVVEFLIQEGGMELMNKDRHADGSGCLQMAGAAGHLDVVKALVKVHPALTLRRDKNGTTPLLHACWKGHSTVVRFFLEDEVACKHLKDIIGMKHRDGRTCLHVESESKQNCLVILKLVCGKGGEQHLFEVDSKGETCFMKECRKGHLECAKFLLDQGSRADGGRRMLDARNQNGKTCWMLACESGNFELFSFLAKKAPPDQLLTDKDNEGGTCFSSACAHGSLQCAEYLIDEAKHSDRFRSVEKGESPEIAQERRLSEELQKSSLSDPAEEEGGDEQHKGQRSNLSEAAIEHEPDLKEFLKGERADMRTCLHLAAESGNIKLFEYLYSVCKGNEMEAELIAEDSQGITPVFLACSKGHSKLVDVINELGIEDHHLYEVAGHNWDFEGLLLKTRDQDGLSCLHIASRNGHLDVVSKLCDSACVANVPRAEATEQNGGEPGSVENKGEKEWRQKVVKRILETDGRGGNCFTSACEKVECEPSKMQDVLKQKVKCARFLFEQVAKQGEERASDAIAKKKPPLKPQLSSVGLRGLTRTPSSVAKMVVKSKELTDDEKQEAKQKGWDDANKLLEAKHKDGATCMHLACESGNVDLLEFLIRETSAWSLLMARNSDSATPLWLACSNGHRGIVNRLLKYVLVADQKDKTKELNRLLAMRHKNGQTCLHAAAAQGNLEIVSRLCDYGCDKMIFDVDEQGATPFLSAIEKGHVRCAKYLLRGAQDREGEIGVAKILEGANNDGRTALHLACMRGSAELCIFLIETGGMHLLKRTDTKGKDPLFYLFESNMETPYKIVEKVIRSKMQSNWKDILKAKDHDGRSCVHVLSQAGDLAALSELCKHLESSELRSDADKRGRTGFLLACEHGRLEVAKLFVTDVGVDVNDSRTHDGQTAVHLACKSGDKNLVVFLLRHGGSKLLKETDERGATCFGGACEKGHKDIAELLLRPEKCGREVLWKKLNDGRTVLHLAAESGNKELLKYLVDLVVPGTSRANVFESLQVGAAAVMGMVQQHSPLSPADKSKLASLFATEIPPDDLLLHKDNRGATCFLSACEAGHKECAVLLLEQCKDLLHGKMNDGKNALHLAVQSGKFELFTALWEEGADKLFHDMDKGGNMPLSLAKNEFSKEFLRLFRQELGENRDGEQEEFQMRESAEDPPNAARSVSLTDHCARIEDWLKQCSDEDLLQVDTEGKTSLHKACLTGNVETFKTVVARLGKKADELVKQKDKEGRTCMHVACAGGHVDLCEHLKAEGGDQLFKAIDKNGLSPLLLACTEGKSEILTALLKGKVQVKDIFKPRSPSRSLSSTAASSPTKDQSQEYRSYQGTPESSFSTDGKNTNMNLAMF